MRPRPIYLDYASTTPLDPSVRQVLAAAFEQTGWNPASQHSGGRSQRKRLEYERERIASLLDARTAGMHADRVIFTSGGTEANNLALFGLAGPQGSRVLVSSIEHPSVSQPAQELARRGYRVEQIAVDSTGVVQLGHLEELLRTSPPPRLASVMLGNSETGAIQPVAEIARLCHEHGALVHTDAVQAIGKMEVSFQALGVDAMTVAPHKFHGPLGIGALLLQAQASIEPLLFGGFQQGGIRPGTESHPLTAGFHEALAQATKSLHENFSHLTGLRDHFESRLLREIEDLAINSRDAQRLPHISNVAFLGLDRQQLFLALDFAGVCCSTGSACASGSSEPSPVLKAMELPERVISSSLRFSFGLPTAREEIDEAVNRISFVVKNLRSKDSRGN
jgi:cysteine desulfurase